jgi:hypothetical protein
MLQFTPGQGLAHRAYVIGNGGRVLIPIAHAQAATQIQVANGDALAGQGIDQVQQALQGIDEGADFRQL